MTAENFKKELTDLISSSLANQYSGPLHAEKWQEIRIALNEVSTMLDEIERK
jgi:hypothetical protein